MMGEGEVNGQLNSLKGRSTGRTHADGMMPGIPA